MAFGKCISRKTKFYSFELMYTGACGEFGCNLIIASNKHLDSLAQNNEIERELVIYTADDSLDLNLFGRALRKSDHLNFIHFYKNEKEFKCDKVNKGDFIVKARTGKSDIYWTCIGINNILIWWNEILSYFNAKEPFIGLRFKRILNSTTECLRRNCGLKV
jgi:hypothetical protein